MTVSPTQVIAAARGYLGAPFAHRGRTRSGVDCAGLIIAVARDLGLQHPGKLYYSPLPACGLITQMLAEYAVSISDPEPGCIVHLNVAGRPQHLAFVGDHGDSGLSLIHGHMTVGRVCEHRLDEKWERRIVGCWRMKGVA